MPTWCSEEVSGAGAQGWKGEGQGCQGGRHAGGPGAGARSRDSTLGQRGAVGEHGAELGPGHSLAQVRKTGWGLAMCQEAAVKSGEETTRGWMKIEETGWWERMPPSGGSRPMSAPGTEARARAEQGRCGGGQGANVQELPCLLGIRRLLTHLEPLVHPKYTPAKVTMETTVSSGSLPHIQTQWRGTALPRPFPKSIHPAAVLLEKRAAPSPRGAWVGNCLKLKALCAQRASGQEAMGMIRLSGRF